MTSPDLGYTKDRIAGTRARHTGRVDEAVRGAGRILVGALFLWAGFDKIFGWHGALDEVTQGGLPFPTLLLTLTIALQLVGGAAIMAGRWLRPSCWALAAFTALATVLYHAFWRAGSGFHSELIAFMEGVAIVGALLVVSTLAPRRPA
jgi:putative oxidoreductase